MKTFKLSPRLSAIEQYITFDSRLIDVGTDHCYLPIYECLNNKCKSVIASDINSGPLDSGKKYAKEYGVFEQIQFRHTPGLQGIDTDQIDTVVIAGMGGELITSILSESDLLSRSDITLVLQPQSKISELITYMNLSGFAIIDGCLVKDSGRIYVVLKYSKKQQLISETDKILPELIAKGNPELTKEYLNHLKRINDNKIIGIDKSHCSDSIDNDIILKEKELLEVLLNAYGK